MTEQQRFSVVATFPEFEVRRYDAWLVTEFAVDGSPEGAGNRAFRRPRATSQTGTEKPVGARPCYESDRWDMGVSSGMR